MKKPLFVVVAVALLLTGCASTGRMGTDTTTASEQPCLDYLSEYIPEEWGEDGIYVSYSTHTAYSGHLVVLVNGTVHHSEYVEHDGAVDADGHLLRLNVSEPGAHAIRVVEYHDNRSDGEFEPAIERPCRVNGTLHDTDTVTVRIRSPNETHR